MSVEERILRAHSDEYDRMTPSLGQPCSVAKNGGESVEARSHTNKDHVAHTMSNWKHSPDLVPVSELLVSLELFPFLLPTHRDYYLDDHGEKIEIEEIAADRVRKILDINCHGSLLRDTIDCNTELYPTVSMMNHESKPNCSFTRNSL